MQRKNRLPFENMDGALTKFGNELPRRVVILRALQLGDLLVAVPALRALRAALPSAIITLVGLPWARTFVQRFNHYIDDFLEFPGYPGLPEREPEIRQIPSFFAEAQNRRFDLALQMHGSGSYMNSILVLLGARINAGFYLPGNYCPDQDRFLPFRHNEHEIRMMLQLIEFLGVPLAGDELEFPLSEADWQKFRAVDEAAELMSSDYVCVHAGARYHSRRWPAERFAVVADALAKRGMRVVLTGTTGEAELVTSVSRSIRAPHFNLAGKTDDLGAFGALLGGARLVVSNDTGVSHIVAGLKVPSVIITSGSDPHRWGPLNHALHHNIYHPIECRPCTYFRCPIGHPCALSVTPEEVIAHADELLQNGQRRSASQCAI
jgi:ADP-heptose:LPS heptosyltransferase